MMGTFKRVLNITSGVIDVPFLVSALVERAPSLEIDAENEKVRVRAGWEGWLFPNDRGTKGVPLYIKQQQQFQEQQYYEQQIQGEEEQDAAAGAASAPTQLSPAAKPFVAAAGATADMAALTLDKPSA